MKNVVIDAGHGGKDPGAIGQLGSKESEIALIIARLVAGKLATRCNVMLTRSGDEYLSLTGRPQMANEWNADAFISIHCNAADNRSAKGWEVFTTRRDNNSDILATCIGEQYKTILPHLKARLDYSDGDLDKEADHCVTRLTDCPSCLFELGFISNMDEEMMLNSELFQDRASDAIALGILDFLNR